MSTDELKTQLLQLPNDVRADLAFALLQSLDGAETGSKESLRETLQHREREILDGTAVGNPAEEVFARLKAKYE